MSSSGRPELEKVEIFEKGAPVDGKPQVSNRRLFFQLLVFTGCRDLEILKDEMEKSGLDLVLYQDVNDPQGVGVLFMTEYPDDITGSLRDLLNTEAFEDCYLREDMTMLGRTYSIGREEQLENWLIDKPKGHALNPDLKWVVWYPLRRKGEFSLLSGEDHGKILMEHAMIGMAYGRSGLAHDIRLACHGIDKNDNEFVIGLLGRDLFPLSHLVQRMRRTQQTSKYIQSMGPFFVGKVFWQSS